MQSIFWNLKIIFLSNPAKAGGFSRKPFNLNFSFLRGRLSAKMSEIDYFMKRFRDCFENIESANRWKKAFIFTTHLRKSFATQKRLTASSMIDNNLNLMELSALQV